MSGRIRRLIASRALNPSDASRNSQDSRNHGRGRSRSALAESGETDRAGRRNATEHDSFGPTILRIVRIL